MRLPGLWHRGAAGIPQRARHRRHGPGPPQRPCLERAARERAAPGAGGPSCRLRLLHAPVAAGQRTVIDWWAHLLVKRTAAFNLRRCRCVYDLRQGEEIRHGFRRAARAAIGETRQGGGGRELPWRGPVGGAAGTGDHGVVRDSPGRLDIRHLRHVSGRGRPAGAPHRRRQGEPGALRRDRRRAASR